MRSSPASASKEVLIKGFSSERLALVMGICAGLAIVLTLDGPGLTIDEPLDVRPGRTYIDILRKEGWHFFDRAVVDRVFRDNAEHPPLGRWLLGIASELGEPIEVLWKGPDPTGHYVLAGRLAPAIAFAVLVSLVTLVSGRRWGLPAGAATGFALLAMPRVFAHAHLAALDTFLSLFWTLALIAGESALRAKRPVAAMAAAGALWALALLTKIHAWFLWPILTAWAFVLLPPRRAVVAISAWASVGICLYALGWPWLWYDSWHRLGAYWGTGVARSSIMVQYFGQVVADRDVPWHYPWFYFAVTVPSGLLVLGTVGVARGWQERRLDLFPLLLVAHDCGFSGPIQHPRSCLRQRAFVPSCLSGLALLVGYGFGWLWDRWLPHRIGRIVLSGFLIVQIYGTLAMNPFGLSYYNGLIGGLPGAERAGLELTYWNDPVDQVLLDRLAREADAGATAALAPTLYPGQGILTTNRALARREVILRDEDDGARAEWLVDIAPHRVLAP